MGFLCGLDVRLARGVALWLGRGSMLQVLQGKCVRRRWKVWCQAGHHPRRFDSLAALWQDRQPNGGTDDGLKPEAFISALKGIRHESSFIKSFIPIIIFSLSFHSYATSKFPCYFSIHRDPRFCSNPAVHSPSFLHVQNRWKTRNHTSPSPIHATYVIETHIVVHSFPCPVSSLHNTVSIGERHPSRRQSLFCARTPVLKGCTTQAAFRCASKTMGRLIRYWHLLEARGGRWKNAGLCRR